MADELPEGCNVHGDTVSDRCELGTRGCTTRHGDWQVNVRGLRDVFDAKRAAMEVQGSRGRWFLDDEPNDPAGRNVPRDTHTVAMNHPEPSAESLAEMPEIDADRRPLVNHPKRRDWYRNECMHLDSYVDRDVSATLWHVVCRDCGCTREWGDGRW